MSSPDRSPGFGWIRRAAAPLAARPLLTAALSIGLLTRLAAFYGARGLTGSTCAILGWDATCLAYITSVLVALFGETPERIKERAATQDEGRGFILALVTVAAAVSLAAIAQELSQAQGDHGWLKAWRVILVFATVAASWLMVQLIFALHYAHDYYATRDGVTLGGLAFPGDECPDYWDFLHFSVVIGVAAQTADIAFTSKPLRRVGTVHSILAFTYNTVVLALTINLLAGLF